MKFILETRGTHAIYFISMYVLVVMVTQTKLKMQQKSNFN
jgi:hypothetical protein